MGWGVAAAGVVGIGTLVVLPSAHGTSIPAADQYEVPAGLPSRHARAADPLDPRLVALARRDRLWDHIYATRVHKHTPAFMATPRTDTDDPPELVLTPQKVHYDLAAVAKQFPDAFTWLPGGGLLLKVPLLVAPKATLVVDSATVPKLYLSSGTKGYAEITGDRATVLYVGHAGRPLRITSYDPATKRADLDRADGRAYLDERGGLMTFDHTDVSYLGFASSGLTSGVAWATTPNIEVTGGATDSTFSHNYFGAYSAAARGLVITRTSFLSNDVYGFDPHTATKDTVVSDSVAAYNGRHGFMFSDGCDGNVVRNSRAFLNGGTGFMIDDGTPLHGFGRPSNHNALVDISSHDNGDVGVVIEGGTGNTVQRARVDNNDDGVEVRNQAKDTVLDRLQITASRSLGISLGQSLGTTHLTDVDIVGATIGIASSGGSATVMTRDRISDMSHAGLRLDGNQTAATFDQVVISHGGPVPLDVRGTPLSTKALAGIDRGIHRSAWAIKWTLMALMHESILLLWAAILALPLASRVPMLVRKIRARPASAA